MVIKILSRTGVLLVSALIGSILVFLLMAVLPGDPAVVALGVNATPEAVAQLRQEYGIDRPLVVQYLDWIGGVLVGDFGTSYITGANITEQITNRFPITFWLIFLGMIIAVVIAIPLGVLSALRQRHRSGTVLAAVSQIGVAVPSFIAAILLINIFAVNLGWLPSGGWTMPEVNFGMFLAQVTLPVIAIGLVQGAMLSRYVRSASLEVMREDYIRTARAKGLGTVQAFFRHGARNASVPVITVLGLQVAALLIDTIVIERVFVIPGMGGLLFDAVANRDLLVVQGVVLVLVIVILIMNYLIDLIYVLVDPRLRRAV